MNPSLFRPLTLRELVEDPWIARLGELVRAWCAARGLVLTAFRAEQLPALHVYLVQVAVCGMPELEMQLRPGQITMRDINAALGRYFTGFTPYVMPNYPIGTGTVYPSTFTISNGAAG